MHEKDIIMKKRIVCALLCAFIAVSLCGCSLINQKASDYAKAQKYLTEGDYDKAISAFEALEGYENSVKYIAYAKCLKLGEEGRYDLAISGLTTMGDFSAAELDRSYYLGRQLEEAGRYEEAKTQYQSVPTYRDSAERLAALEDRLLERDLSGVYDLIRSGNRDEAYYAALAARSFSNGETGADRLFVIASALKDEGCPDESYFLFGILEKAGSAGAAMMRSILYEDHYAVHTLTYVREDGQESFSYQVGSAIDTSYPVPEKTGYTGVWQDENGAPLPAVMGKSDLTVHAVYTLKSRTLTVMNGENVLFTCTTGEGMVIDYTGLYLPQAPAGYASRWSESLPYVMPDRDTVIQALIEPAASLPEIKPASEARVYYTVNGTYYHLYPNCSGMVNAASHTLEQAKAAGKSTCENCGVMSFALLGEKAEYLWIDGKNVAHTTDECASFYKDKYRLLPMDQVYQGVYTYCDHCGAVACYEYMRQHDDAYNINYADLDEATRLLYQYEKSITVYFYEDSSRYYHENPDCMQMRDPECVHTLFDALHITKLSPCPACEPCTESQAKQHLNEN